MPSARNFDAARGPAYTDKWRWFLPLGKFPADAARANLESRSTSSTGWATPITTPTGSSGASASAGPASHVPALNFDGWYDIFLNGATENFAGMRKQGGSAVARDGQRLVIGPWVHISWQQSRGPYRLRARGRQSHAGAMLRWYDYWLKGIQNGVDKDPRVKVFVMGANMWRSANEWPIEGTEFRKYYLLSQGHANTATGDGRLEQRRTPAPEPPRTSTDTIRPTPCRASADDS